MLGANWNLSIFWYYRAPSYFEYPATVGCSKKMFFFGRTTTIWTSPRMAKEKTTEHKRLAGKCDIGLLNVVNRNIVTAYNGYFWLWHPIQCIHIFIQKRSTAIFPFMGFLYDKQSIDILPNLNKKSMNVDQIHHERDIFIFSGQNTFWKMFLYVQSQLKLLRTQLFPRFSEYHV